MTSGRSIPLMRIFGIQIGVDPSLFLLLFVFIWFKTDNSRSSIPGTHDNRAFLLATVSTLLFFASILLHELGHAVVAIRNRIPIAGIDLWLFGGIAKMTRESPSPGAEFRIAIAGPAVAFCIAVVCAGIGLAASNSGDFWNAAAGSPSGLGDQALA